MIYFTSDLHLLRPDEHIFESRGYKSTQEMAKDYVRKINSIVKETDELYILGDILGGKLEESIKLFKQINCSNITVINGNYETDESKELLMKTGKIKDMKDSLFVRLNDYKFFLCHFPCRTGDFSLAGDPIKRKI